MMAKEFGMHNIYAALVEAEVSEPPNSFEATACTFLKKLVLGTGSLASSRGKEDYASSQTVVHVF